MEYFILQQNALYSDAPKVIDWYGKIDTNHIVLGQSHKLKQRYLFHIASNKEIIFTDIVTFPFLMVSDIFKKTIKMYEPHTPFKQIVLFDSKNKTTQLYHLPILKKIECLDEKSSISIDRSVLHQAVLDRDKIEDLSIFQIAGIRSTYTVIRLDLLESILRREAKGIDIIPVDIVGGSYE